jgi:hypothetical protein
LGVGGSGLSVADSSRVIMCNVHVR